MLLSGVNNGAVGEGGGNNNAFCLKKCNNNSYVHGNKGKELKREEGGRKLMRRHVRSNMFKS